MRIFPLALMIVLVMGCEGRRPGGQVIAVVNDAEITIVEFNQELRARGISAADDPAAKQVVLQDLIERKLLAQSARKIGLDRTPEHILEERRLVEMLLAQERTSDARTGLSTPSPSDISTFIKDNPQAFANRLLLTVDQLTFQTPPAAVMAAVGRAQTIDQAAAILKARRVNVVRSVETWDSAGLTPKVAGELREGGRFPVRVIDQMGHSLAVQVRTAIPRPTSADERDRLARQLYVAQQSQRRSEQLVVRERKAAKIEVHPSF